MSAAYEYEYLYTFRISTKNLALIDIEPSVAPESFLGILRAVKYGVRSYHDLFKRLCLYAGIHCEVIHGYSKGAGYTPGSFCFITVSYEYLPIKM